MRYKPSPTVLAFMASRKFIKLICGPVGGGKSTGALMALWTMATQQKPFNNVRRTKYIILRNTMAQLKSTVKPLIDQWFVELPSNEGTGPLGVWKMTTDNGSPTFHIKARLRDGTILHTEFILLAADTPDDVRRLLSMECSGAWVEEAREIDSSIFEGLQGRTMRFPNRDSGGVTYPCVICSTNPPPIGSYWHKLMTETPGNAEVFMQPAAMLEDGSLNPNAENLDHLDVNYYPMLMEGKTEDWIAVYLKNKFGSGGMGQPVFKGTFRRDFHVHPAAKERLKPIPSEYKRVIVGSDNGLTAAAVIGQEDARGRVNVFGEAFVPMGETMGYDRFLANLLIPKLRDLMIPHKNVLFVVDPACFHRSEATEVTIAQVIQRAGFQVVAAPTNDPERRIAAAEGLFMRQVDGGPGVLIDEAVCPHLVNTLDWGYRNKKTTNEKGQAVPDKNHYSHMGDGWQYFSLHFNAAAASSFTGKRQAQQITKREYVYA